MCKREDQTLRAAIALIAAFVIIAGANISLAQPANPSPGEAATCPPDVKGNPPTVGGRSSEPLSDKLAQSKGVICPPAGVDRKMQVTPPGGGQLKVIPPPGTPGGYQLILDMDRLAKLSIDLFGADSRYTTATH